MLSKKKTVSLQFRWTVILDIGNRRAPHMLGMYPLTEVQPSTNQLESNTAGRLALDFPEMNTHYLLKRKWPTSRNRILKL